MAFPCSTAGSLQHTRECRQLVGFTVSSGLEKIRRQQDDLAASMSHNLRFYNTRPFLVTFVMGIVPSPPGRTSWISQPFVQSAFLQYLRFPGRRGDALFWIPYFVSSTAGITSVWQFSGNVFCTILVPYHLQHLFGLRSYWLMNLSYSQVHDSATTRSRTQREFLIALISWVFLLLAAWLSCYGGDQAALAQVS